MAGLRLVLPSDVDEASDVKLLCEQEILLASAIGGLGGRCGKTGDTWRCDARRKWGMLCDVTQRVDTRKLHAFTACVVLCIKLSARLELENHVYPTTRIAMSHIFSVRVGQS